VKLIFACPTYGPLESESVRSQRVAIMHAAKSGHEWIGDISPNRSAWTVARNTIAAQAIETDADAVFWCDSDVILPPHAISWLAGHQKDFICGIYFQRYPPHFPLIAHYQPQKDTFAWFIDWPPNVIAPIDGCGFGCVLTSTALLKRIGTKDWFTYQKFSEDFDFCRKATAAGSQLYVHTGVVCGHLKDPAPATLDDFKSAWAETVAAQGDAAIGGTLTDKVAV